MLIEDALNLLDEMMDRSLSIPFSSGRCVIDIDKVRDIIDDIRMNMPNEIQQAEALLAQREEIVKKANETSESIVRKAEERARIILAQDEAVKAAQQKANEILSQAQNQSKELRMATQKFSDNVLKNSEDTLIKALDEVRNTRKILRNKAPNR